MTVSRVRYDVSLLTPEDLHYFNEGTHCRLYRKLGAHPLTVDGEAGYVLRPLGAQRPERVRDGGFQWLGPGKPPPAAPGLLGPLGRVHSRRPGRPPL